MSVEQLVRSNRSYRRFDGDFEVEFSTLRELVNLARFSPSAANLQPLKFYLSNTPEVNEKIFHSLAWAGYIEGWDGPGKGERPTSYIVVMGDTELAETFEYDTGIACQSMLLGAVERGLGGCILGACDRDEIAYQLEIPERYEIQVVVALGKPAEEVVIDDGGEEKVKYYRDAEDVHHVPKRPLDELIVDF